MRGGDSEAEQGVSKMQIKAVRLTELACMMAHGWYHTIVVRRLFLGAVPCHTRQQVLAGLKYSI